MATRSTAATVTILHGDAYDLLRSLDAGSIDLLITSPPYWGHRTYELEHNWDILQDWLSTGAQRTDVPDYGWYRDRGGSLGLEPFPEWYVAHLVEMMELFRPALKPAGSIGSIWATPISLAGRASARMDAKDWAINPASGAGPRWAATVRKNNCS